MSPKRQRIVLELAIGGLKSTDLVEGHRINRSLACEYLSDMWHDGLLNRSTGKQPFTYTLTEAGRKRLDAIKTGTAYEEGKRVEDESPWDFGPLLECWG